jgi:predicted MPP superfamily phosphohydrolase
MNNCYFAIQSQAMRPLFIIAFFTLFMVGMDLYALRGIQHLLFPERSVSLSFVYIYWGITLLMFLALLRAGTQFQHLRDPSRFFGVMLIIGIFLMLYIPKLTFNLTQLLGDISMAVASLFRKDAADFRSWFLVPGAILGLLVFLAFGWGMARGRTHVKLQRESITIPGLPQSFHGLRVIQLSDIHLAGFYHHPEYIRKVVGQVNQLQPDLILFTGDLVHNFAEETDPFVEILNGLKAPMGKFAVLGNHDYGAYFQWPSKEEEAANLEQVKEQVRACGFDLLLNEHRTLSLNGDSLEIIGVENWGKPPFPQHGDLARALEGSDPALVRILLSHDPSHWDLQVRGKEDLELTLSGHTHGMQFGIEIGNFKWSPSRWTYKHWGGLYKENGQYLYVNRGLGYTGFPGRVGIRPEITLLTLQPE